MKLDVDLTPLQECADMMLIKPFEMGRKAKKDYRHKASNPFEVTDVRHQEWLSGYNSLS